MSESVKRTERFMSWVNSPTGTTELIAAIERMVTHRGNFGTLMHGLILEVNRHGVIKSHREVGRLSQMASLASMYLPAELDIPDQWDIAVLRGQIMDEEASYARRNELDPLVVLSRPSMHLAGAYV